MSVTRLPNKCTCGLIDLVTEIWASEVAYGDTTHCFDGAPCFITPPSEYDLLCAVAEAAERWRTASFDSWEQANADLRRALDELRKVREG